MAVVRVARKHPAEQMPFDFGDNNKLNTTSISFHGLWSKRFVLKSE